MAGKLISALNKQSTIPQIQEAIKMEINSNMMKPGATQKDIAQEAYRIARESTGKELKF